MGEWTRYYNSALVIFGTIGNFTTIYIFLATKLNKHTSSYYLVSLSVSDSVALLCVFAECLTIFGVHWFFRDIICHILIYSFSASSFLSVWLIVAFTVERFIAVSYPFLWPRICSRRNALRVIYLLVFFSLAFNIPVLIFTEVGPYGDDNKTEECVVKKHWRHAHMVHVFVDSIMSMVCPLLIVTILNICVICNIWNLSSRRRRLTNSYEFQRRREDSKTPKCFEVNMTKMLLFVSMLSSCLNSPSYVMRILASLAEMKYIQIATEDEELFKSLQHYFQLPFYTNFGINFVLYCISGQNFRKAVKGIFCRNSNLRRSDTPATESRTLSTSTSIVSKKRRATTTEALDYVHVHQKQTEEV